MYRFLKQNTKQANQLINAYDNSISSYGLRTLDDCYNNYSYDKARSYYNIKLECENLDGYDFTILSHNPFQYSCGYVYPDSETGALILRVETASSTYETWYV